MLEQAKVAGTVILNQEDGHKKFLVRKSSSHVEFVMTEVDAQYTSLACILNEFKEKIHLNTGKMELVELTSVNLGKSKMPLYVFSLDEDKENEYLDKGMFTWEGPETLREILKKFQVTGVPYLS